jgi:hypothetical protein
MCSMLLFQGKNNNAQENDFIFMSKITCGFVDPFRKEHVSYISLNRFQCFHEHKINMLNKNVNLISMFDRHVL